MEPKELKTAYDEYVARIKTRITNGETTLKTKSLKDWQKVGADKDGKKIPVPGETGETKSESSTRIATNRMDKLITAFDRLNNMSSGNYRFTAAQVDKMVTVINTQSIALIAMLERKKEVPAEEGAPVEKKFEF